MAPKSKTMRFLLDMYIRFRDDDVPGVAAQLTFYLILSFFPFLLFVVSLLGFVQLSGDSLVAELIRLLPAETGESISQVLEEITQGSNGTLLSVGMLVTIWSASSGMNAIIKGMNTAYEEQESRPFWKIRGIALIATLVLGLVITLVMLMHVFGQTISSYLFDLLHVPSESEWVWNLVKYAIPLAAMLIVFTMLYWIAPNRRLTLKEVLPGVLFTTIGWVAASMLFQFYINNFGNYSKTYGSIGGIIILLVWLFITSHIILLGGEMNASLARLKMGQTLIPLAKGPSMLSSQK
ncbi:membrane protein [Paenibacillus algorifonticola]|uniref:Membrane protein n=1 Tax=Paenibacillus algorifonticola TaxID=684063 RepID=A0A1I2GNW9_9BACL|nr:YihY/virulence factor BrkB family protein [Paenibacillus algorifonticola]SFF18710.1 membrane protein [Paenibacillus algorifonticola]